MKRLSIRDFFGFQKRLVKTRNDAPLQFLRNFLEETQEAFVLLDSSGSILFWNKASEEILGWKKIELEGRKFVDLLVSSDSKKTFEESVLKPLAESGKKTAFDFPLLHRDSREILIRAKPTSHTDENGNFFAGLFLHELTPTHHIKLDNQQSEESFRFLVQGVRDYAIFMLDPTGHITSWNSGAQSIKGYEESEIIGRHFSCFYTEDAIAKDHPQNELEIAKRVGRYEEEGPRVRKDGSVFWANVLITALYDSKNTLTGFAKVTRDVTERIANQKNLELAYQNLERMVQNRTEELLARQSQLYLIANALPVFVAQFDSSMRVLFMNQALKSWLGIEAEEVTGIPIFKLIGMNRYALVESLFQFNPSKKTEVFEQEVLIKGVSVFLRVSVIPEFFENGTPKGYIFVASDITDHKKIETELSLAKQQAEAANIAKSTFLAHMSHELRTPLGAVLGFSDLLSGMELPPESRDYIAAIRRNGDLLLSIVGSILDLSKIEAGKIEIEKNLTSLPELLNDLYAILNLQAVSKNIELHFNADGEIPSEIETDPIRLKQILVNMIGNAIKFTEKGGVALNVALRTDQLGKNTLEFNVSDTGIGLSQEQCKRLFQPFSQADSTTTRRYGGSGLGLVLSRELARKLGGDLVLTQSSPGAGSIFTLTLDVGLTKEQKLTVLSTTSGSENLEKQEKQLSSTNLNGFKVLVVDDVADNRFIINRFLSSAKALVTEAENGRDALQKLAAQKFDAVLLDLEMPVLDGFDTIAKLRASGNDVYTIALSAHALKDIKIKCLNLGFNEYVSKPVRRVELLQKLQEHLKDR